MRRLLRRTPGLAVAAAADQALSSGTNVLTLLVGARVLAPDRFGAVVVALGVAMVAVTAQRALVGDTLLACAAAAPEEAQRRMSRDALATAGAIGLAGAAAGMALGALPYRLLADLGWMAVWLPAVCLQDGYRYRFFCARRPDLALRADAGWAAVQGAVLLAALLGGRLTTPVFLAAWGTGAAGGAVVGAACARLGPFGGRPGRWLRQTRQLSGWFAGQSLLAQGHSQLVVFVVGGTLGAAAVGGLRAIQLVLMLPAQSLLLAAQSMIVPALARRAARGDLAGIRHAVGRLAAGFGLTAAAVGGLVVALRVPLVELVFTARFRPYADLMIPLAAVTVCYAARAPFMAACRSLRNARGVFLVQAAFTAATVPAVWLGALGWGVPGSAWGLAAGSAVLLVFAAGTYRRSLDRAGHTVQRREEVADAPPARSQHG